MKLVILTLFSIFILATSGHCQVKASQVGAVNNSQQNDVSGEDESVDGVTDYKKCKAVSKSDAYPDYDELFSACGGAEGLENFAAHEKLCFNCYLGLAVHYLDMGGHADKVRENTTRAIALKPSDVRPYELRAKADTTPEGEGLMDHLGQAMSDYLKLAELEPGNTQRKTDACRAGGESPRGFTDKTLRDKLIEACTTAIMAEPKVPNNYIDRAALLIPRGDYAAALSDYNKAIKLDEKDQAAYLGKAAVYEQLKDWTNAARSYDKYFAVGGTEQYYLTKRGASYSRLGLCPKAKADFEAVTEGGTELYAMHYLLAYYWTCEKDLNKTLGYVEKLLKREWCEGGPCYNLRRVEEFTEGLESKPEYRALLEKYPAVAHDELRKLNGDKSPVIMD